MGQTVHSCLRIADAENARQLRSRFETILNVPHTRKELSWPLGVGGWKLARLGQRHCRLTVSPARTDVALFLHRAVRLACGLVGGRFEHPRREHSAANESIENHV